MNKSFKIPPLLILLALLSIFAMSLKAESRLQQFESAKNTSAYQQYNRAYLHYKDLNNDSALYFVNKAISLAIKENNKFQEASFSLNAGILYDRMGDNANCAKNFERAYKLFLEIEDYTNAVSALNNYGTIHITINQPEEAARILFNALKIAEDKNLIKQKGMIYSNLGLLFYYQEEWDKSISYYYKAIPFYLQSENYKSLALIYNNVGISYYFKNVLDSVLYNFEKSLEMYVELDDKFGQTRPLFNIGEIYFTNGDYEKAFEYYNKSLALEKEIGYIKGAAISLVNIGALYAEIKQYDKAFEYLFESLPLIDSVQDKHTLMDAYSDISATYQKVGNDSKALEYFKLYSNTKDTIYNLDKTKQVAELEAIYQTEKAEKEILLLQQKRGRTQRFLIIILSVLSLAILSIIFLIIFHKLREKATIEKALSREKSQHFKALIFAQENERKRIAGELHDSVGPLLSLSQLYISDLADSVKSISSEEKEQFNKSITILTEAADETRNISHNLMPGVLVRSGLHSAIKELIDKLNASRRYSMTFESNLNGKRFEENIEITYYRICQELINNVLKHAEATEITVQLTNDSNQIQLCIADNGKGFNSKNITQDSGIGWKSIKSRLSMIDGKAEIYSSDKGTNIQIKTPLPILNRNMNK